MRVPDIIRRSGRNLKNAKLRTFLTSMAIAVGAFTLTITLAASNGLRDYTGELVANNFDPAELLVGRDPEVANTGAPSDKPQEYDPSITNLQQGPGSSFQVKRVTQADIEELKAKPYVESVRENFQIAISYITRTGQKQYTGSVEPYNPAQKPSLSTGVLPSTGNIPKGTVLLPDNYVGVLGFSSNEDALGKTIDIHVRQPVSQETIANILGSGSQISPSEIQPKEEIFTYTVVGVTKKEATSLTFGVQPIRISDTDARVLYDFTTKGTNDYQKFIFVNARIKDGQSNSAIEKAKADLTGAGYYAVSSEELQKAIMQIVDILSIMVGVFGLITVMASVFGIVNTQYISVLERTREIGLMKALGMSRWGINSLFMFEATWIGFIGGVLGSFVGMGIATVLNPVISKQLGLGEGNSLLVINPYQIVLLVAALMVVATVAGLLPARKAARLDPIEALRTE